MEIREIQKVVSKEGKTAQRLQENGRYSIIRYKKVKARKTMIDIHCHLLYGVDDGAKTIEESVAMLEAAKEQGISAMILTPHYRHGMFAYPKEEIEEHFRILEPYAQKLGIYLALGTEYHVNSHIVEALDSGRCRTMAGSRYVLCEYSHDSEYAYIYQMTQELVLHGYIPVFAHVERYGALADLQLAEELRNLGAWITVNADAVLGLEGMGPKKYCKKMLKAECVDAIASDSHGIKNRANHMGKCYELIEKKFVIENDDEIEIDLKDLVLEILSFWKWVLFALIIGAVTAYCISRFVMVPQYESTSQFYVLSKSMSITSLADIQTGTSLTNDYMVIVEGRPVLEQVIENLGLDETYSSLKKKVTLNNPSNSRILEITVRDANPSMAKKIADEIARVSVAFIQQKMDQDAPNIIQKGYSDGEPVSPNIMKNTAVGGILGMFLAIAVIVVAYLFNDTIMNADDVQRKLGLNVLGTLPLEEAEYDGEKERKRKRRKKKK